MSQPARADRRKLRAIRDRLRTEYGRPVLRPHRAPIDELVLTVLSQNTSDRNRDVAYARLRERFSSWEEVRRAPLPELRDAIRPGGLGPTKSVRIKRILDELARRGEPSPWGDTSQRGEPSRPAPVHAVLREDELSWLADAPLEEARDYLVSLPGVGRKTAACVLLFSYGRPEVPVDTHVFRVGSRLGLFRERASFEEAHDEMLRLTDPAYAYEIHVLLIRHGRRTCTARAPRCADCPLRRMCPEGRRRLAAAR